MSILKEEAPENSPMKRDFIHVFPPSKVLYIPLSLLGPYWAP